MRIVVAMDSFKSSIPAHDACKIVADAIVEYLPHACIVIKPMADGGEGTARAMIEALNGQWVAKEVMGPLESMKVKAGFAWFQQEEAALVEMAIASGLELLRSDQLDPLKTTTYGTGQLIKAAAEYGARKIMLAVGGSATVDGGVGAATALGWKFVDKQALPIPLGGTGLEKIAGIIKPNTLPLPPVEVLCDVDNPLCGEHGAAKIYGPQKGASPEMVKRLDRGLSNLSSLVLKQLKTKIDDVPGAGAAGGLAAGAIAFMDAKLVSGIDAIIDYTGLAEQIATSEWVITGEGRFDRQSLQGKVVSGIAKIACKAKVPVAVLAGSVGLSKEEYENLGIADAISVKKDDMSLDYAIANSEKLLAEAAFELARKHLVSRYPAKQ